MCFHALGTGEYDWMGMKVEVSFGSDIMPTVSVEGVMSDESHASKKRVEIWQLSVDNSGMTVKEVMEFEPLLEVRRMEC